MHVILKRAALCKHVMLKRHASTYSLSIATCCWVGDTWNGDGAGEHQQQKLSGDVSGAVQASHA
jgi:hypothetical protein